MRLQELVSDWELEEIRDELASGTAPDVVAFRHGVPQNSVRDYRKGMCETSNYVRRFDDFWTEAEKSFVRDNYPNHGKGWDGWSMLDRTWDAIKVMASRLGVRRRRKMVNEEWRKSNRAMFGYWK